MANPIYEVCTPASTAPQCELEQRVAASCLQIVHQYKRSLQVQTWFNASCALVSRVCAFAAKQSELEQLVAASCQQIVHANEVFVSSELRTFQEVRSPVLFSWYRTHLDLGV
jgi:hypothetical protein